MLHRKKRAAARALWSVATCGLIASALPGAALADEADAPQAAAARSVFEDAMRLMDAGRAAEACPKFAESNRLDPGMGVKYRLAICYETTGRLASAWVMFTQVADEAAAAKMGDREKVARGRADSLRLKLPRMLVLVPADVAGTSGLELKLDGEPLRPALFGTSLPVDPGKHVISVVAPGKRQWETTAEASEAATITVTIPSLKEEPQVMVAPTASATTAAATTPPAEWGGRHTAGVVIAGLGIVGLGLGTGLGVDAMGKHNGSKAACPSRTGCSPEAIELENAAKGTGAVATIGLVAGGVALAGGAVLFLTAPWPFAADSKKSGATVGFRASAQGATLILEGGF